MAKNETATQMSWSATDAARSGKTPDNASEQEREAIEALREHLRDPEFRAISGFPEGSDDDILALSVPPYYTACPNPFIEQFIERWGRSANAKSPRSAKTPFASDVSEGKNNALYMAHSYHTKVPHRAIMRYILHYTDPGDVVLDVFAGTGMTGVAAQLCGNASEVGELGYTVQEDGSVLGPAGDAAGIVGSRKAILSELSPAASFIAASYNIPLHVETFRSEIRRILNDVDAKCGWMYQTLHQPLPAQLSTALDLSPDAAAREPLPWGRINYTVWSDVFVCSSCSADVVFWEAAVETKGKVEDQFPCPSCGVILRKRSLQRATETRFDEALGIPITQIKQVPVLINYVYGGKRYEKGADQYDLKLLTQIDQTEIPDWYPIDRMPVGSESRRNDPYGLTHVHHFFTRRNLRTLAALRERCSGVPLLVFQSIVSTLCSRFVRYNMGNRGNGPLSGTLYVASLVAEADVLKAFRGKAEDFQRALKAPDHSIVTTQSSTNLQIPDNSVDYIFTDPPFGGNLMYSELNFVWEAWLRVRTNTRAEAIENRATGKSLGDYGELMYQSFSECFRVLKPGRWMTVEFHNSQNRVWNIIQEAILRAGFVVADIKTLDKQQGTFKQVTSGGAVKQDLIISAYKPAQDFATIFEVGAGTEEGVWEFVRQHLSHLSIPEARNGMVEQQAERQPFLLFDRMVAFHIQRGLLIPMSAAEFYTGLRQRFLEEDGMIFLAPQLPLYLAERAKASSVAQLALFVTDEKSAIQWLRQQLHPASGGESKTYQQLLPEFLQQLHPSRHEQLPELSEVLAQNFLEDSQDRWYVPDPAKAGDLEKMRQRELLRVYESYKGGRGKLKSFRSEAIRAGFADAYRRGDYAEIVKLAERIPEERLQEDADMLMYYDNASLRFE